jgi:hypothetical protein
MLSKPKAPDAIDPNYGRPGRSPTGPLPGTLIGMSLRQDIPGELLSSRARFRFSCHDHSETDDTGCQQKSSEQRSVPTSRVSKVDTSHQERTVTHVSGLDTFDMVRRGGLEPPPTTENM